MARWGSVWAMIVLAAVRAQAGELDADEIVRRNFTVAKVVDSRAAVTMTLVSESGARRERSTETLSKLLPNGIDQKRLVRFLTPADVKGTATLLVEHSDGEDDIWIYLPALHGVRRLVSNNKKDTFVVDSVPRTDDVRQSSGYGKRRLWIRSDSFVAVKGLYWDPAGVLMKELS